MLHSDGAECSVFDVVFNPECLEKCKEDGAFREFLIGVSIENIRHKCSLELDTTFTFPNMKYKVCDESCVFGVSHGAVIVQFSNDSCQGTGPPRVQHIKKSGVLKKPLVELVDDADDERQAAALSQRKSEFKLNFDQMYNKAPASAKPGLPSVASLLAPTPSHEPASATSWPVVSLPVASSSVSAKLVPEKVPDKVPANSRSAPSPSLAVPAAPKPIAAVASSSVRAHGSWQQEGIVCELQCPSLSTRNAAMLLFDASQWDDEVRLSQPHPPRKFYCCTGVAHMYA